MSPLFFASLRRIVCSSSSTTTTGVSRRQQEQQPSLVSSRFQSCIATLLGAPGRLLPTVAVTTATAVSRFPNGRSSVPKKRLLSCYLCAALLPSFPVPSTPFAAVFVASSSAPPTPSTLWRTTMSSSSSSTVQMSDSNLSSTLVDVAQSFSSMAVSDNDDAKLVALRTSMKANDLDVYLVPSDDPHLSEYVPDAYMRRAFLSGFKGSAGTAVVTTTVDNSDGNGAWLWTDSRYWNEATLQLDARHWRLQKSGLADTLSIPKWLAKTALEHRRRQEQQHNSNNNISTKDDTKIKTTSTIKPLRIGIDPYVHSASFAKEVTDALTDMAKEESLDNDKAPIGVLVTLPNNLVDAVWGDARPAIPVSPFRVHPVEYAGATVAEKIASIRKEMQSKKATAAVFCTLDDVAYVLNLRAKGDIDTCPVGIAYCMVTNTDVFLYCDSAKVVNVQDHLSESHVSVQPYDQIVSDVEQHCQASLKHKVWLDKSRSNYALANGIPLAQLVDSQNAVTPMKAVKNAAELAGMREAHIVDGVAMAKFMAWLQAEICEKGRSISEVELDHVLTGFRAEQKGFTELSFPTIAGVGSNGAIIHYRASADSDLLKYLDKSKPILIDSGGQYLYGTTDVTRTWSFQEQPDPVFCDYYTRVLKGNIGVDSMVFPENTPGLVLDVFARRWLWDIGSDYGHGTGHGVGAALNVHEGPHSISPRWANTEVLKPGMIVSNEPGYYEDGNFGIRIENLLEILFVKPEDNESSKNESDKPKSPQKKFMKFAKLTMIPIQKNLIDIRLMTDHEMDWIDGYHAEVLEKVGARLEEGSPALTWLQCACEKMNRV